VNGLLITFLPALLLSFMGNLGLANTTFGDSDFCWAGILGGSISRLGTTGAYLGIILVSVVLLFCPREEISSIGGILGSGVVLKMTIEKVLKELGISHCSDFTRICKFFF